MGTAEPNLVDDIHTVLQYATERKLTRIRRLSDSMLRLMSSYTPSELDPQEIAAIILYISKAYNLQIEIAGGGYGCTFVATNVKGEKAISSDMAANILENNVVQQLADKAGIELISIDTKQTIQTVRRELSSCIFYISNRERTTFNELTFGKVRVSRPSKTKKEDEKHVSAGWLETLWRKTSQHVLGPKNEEIRLGDEFLYEDEKEFSSTLRILIPDSGVFYYTSMATIALMKLQFVQLQR